MKKKKKAFLLTEMVIALSLAAIVFSFLFRSYFDFVKSEHQFKAIEERIHFKHRFYVRLRQIFSALKKPELFPQFPSKNFLYTDSVEQKLCFIFNNEIDADPQFSGQVWGELYLKKEKLLLTLISKKEHKRIELEYPDIREVTWSFFDPQEKKWASEWPKEKNFSPLIFRLIIREKSDEKESIYYFFPTPPKMIYPQEAISL